jgi:ubiquinone/menaquinone biosynthesis C-methylase UbiE
MNNFGDSSKAEGSVLDSSATTDRWAKWVRENDARSVAWLHDVRDLILDAAAIGEGTVVLDLGAGNGLMGIGAAERGAEVIFTDISAPLLSDCRAAVAGLPRARACRFEQAAAENLGSIASRSVDAVTSRSTLIYVDDRCAALREAFRVLRPGGRLGVFEPLNGFWGDHDDTFFGYRLPESVRRLGDTVRAAWRDQYRRLLSFDATELIRSAEVAGFSPVDGFIEAKIAPGGSWSRDWESALEMAPNPLAMSLREAIESALDADAASIFRDALRPLVEHGEGVTRTAALYLFAKKPD